MIPSRKAPAIIPRCRWSNRRTWHLLHSARRLSSAFVPSFPLRMWSMCAVASLTGARQRTHCPPSRSSTLRRKSCQTSRGGRCLGTLPYPYRTVARRSARYLTRPDHTAYGARRFVPAPPGSLPYRTLPGRASPLRASPLLTSPPPRRTRPLHRHVRFLPASFPTSRFLAIRYPALPIHAVPRLTEPRLTRPCPSWACTAYRSATSNRTTSKRPMPIERPSPRPHSRPASFAEASISPRLTMVLFQSRWKVAVHPDDAATR